MNNATFINSNLLFRQGTHFIKEILTWYNTCTDTDYDLIELSWVYKSKFNEKKNTKIIFRKDLKQEIKKTGVGASQITKIPLLSDTRLRDFIEYEMQSPIIKICRIKDYSYSFTFANNKTFKCTTNEEELIYAYFAMAIIVANLSKK